MVTVGVEELKSKLGEYLARVKAGEEVLVTERGQPVARLEPVRPPTESEEERMERLYAAGLIRRGAHKGLPPDFFDDMPEDPDGLVLKALLEEREEGP
jgi:prevent-host-death family protein